MRRSLCMVVSFVLHQANNTSLPCQVFAVALQIPLSQNSALMQLVPQKIYLIEHARCDIWYPQFHDLQGTGSTQLAPHIM